MFATNFGLLIIALAWVIQFVSMHKKGKEIAPAFLGVYSLGLIILVLDSWQGGVSYASALNLASLIIALMVFSKVSEKK